MPLQVTDADLMELIRTNVKLTIPYAGAFLKKDDRYACGHKKKVHNGGYDSSPPAPDARTATSLRPAEPNCSLEFPTQCNLCMVKPYSVYR